MLSNGANLAGGSPGPGLITDKLGVCILVCVSLCKACACVEGLLPLLRGQDQGRGEGEKFTDTDTSTHSSTYTDTITDTNTEKAWCMQRFCASAGSQGLQTGTLATLLVMSRPPSCFQWQVQHHLRGSMDSAWPLFESLSCAWHPHLYPVRLTGAPTQLNLSLTAWCIIDSVDQRCIHGFGNVLHMQYTAFFCICQTLVQASLH